MEIKFVLWFAGALLAILAFIGALAVNSLIKMAHDIHEIKMTIATESAERKALEKRVEHLEDIVEFKTERQ